MKINMKLSAKNITKWKAELDKAWIWVTQAPDEEKNYLSHTTSDEDWLANFNGYTVKEVVDLELFYSSMN